jgi:hypothetical protein
MSESWAGLTLGTEEAESWDDMVDDEVGPEPIVWPDDEPIDPWTDKGMFTNDKTLIVGEPIDPTWVVDNVATHMLP